MARMTLMQVGVPAGVGLIAGGAQVFVENSELNLQKRIAEGASPPGTELNMFVKNLSNIVELGVGIAGPALYLGDVVRESQGGRELASSGLAIGARRLAILAGRGILGLGTPLPQLVAAGRLTGGGSRYALADSPRQPATTSVPAYFGEAATGMWEHTGV